MNVIGDFADRFASLVVGAGWHPGAQIGSRYPDCFAGSWDKKLNEHQILPALVYEGMNFIFIIVEYVACRQLGRDSV